MLKQTLPLLAALALGCSSGSQYERGAYTPPVRAPAFDPATDAPHTRGQPGYVNGQRTQRSPNKRYVEPSREPQMMAADGDDARAIQLMCDEPVPNVNGDDAINEDFAKCWKDFQKMIKERERKMKGMSKEEMVCLRHHVLTECGISKSKARARVDGVHREGAFEAIMAAANRARCGPGDVFYTRTVLMFHQKFNEQGRFDYGWGK